MTFPPATVRLGKATLESLQKQLNELAERQQLLGNAIDEIKELIKELKQ